MSKIIISSDSTTDLSAELKERYGVRIIPLGVTLGTKVYRDGIDIDPDFIYEHHDKTGELPKTTAANVGECVDYFTELKKEGDAVIHFTISSGMSSTYNNACLAASEFEDVYVIDSLEYLYKGGRCSALAMMGANLLKLKPCIEVKNGVMGVGKKYRGAFSKVINEYVSERLVNIDDIDTSRVFVTHAGCDPEVVNSVVEQVKSLGVFKEVFMTRAGCTISSHCGANTLGVLFIRKSPIA